MIIYCHGFGSSGQATKAIQLRKYFGNIQVETPDLPPEPFQALAKIKSVIVGTANEPMLLVGSSLGGFYALWLHQEQNVPAVLLNPAVNPAAGAQDQDKLTRHFEPQALSAWRGTYVAQLRELVCSPTVINPQNLYVFLNRNDEILDSHQTQTYFQPCGCFMKIYTYGGHRFGNFNRVLPYIDRIYRRLPN